MTGARFVNAHVILHAIYPSGTFSAEKACFSLKIKNLTNQTCFFVSFLFPSFFLDFDSFLFRFFLSKRKRNFICLTFFFQSSLTTSLEWISDYESFPFPLDTMPMYFAQMEGNQLERSLYILAGLLYKKPRPIKHWYSSIWNSRGKFSLLLFWEPVTARDWLDNTRCPSLLCFVDFSIVLSNVPPLLPLLKLLRFQQRYSPRLSFPSLFFHFKNLPQIATNPERGADLSKIRQPPSSSLAIGNTESSINGSLQFQSNARDFSQGWPKTPEKKKKKQKKKGRQKVGTEPDTLGNTVARRQEPRFVTPWTWH